VRILVHHLALLLCAADSAKLTFEFWMDPELQRGAIARAMHSVPDTIGVRVTLADSTHLSWLVVAKRQRCEREQSAAASMSESMFVEAPPVQLARFYRPPA
jgi:hypothetical protein